jgi:hypothetical protein
MLAGHGGPQDLILATRGNDLDEAVALAFGDGPVQVIETVGGDLVVNALLPGFGLIQTHTPDFR